MGQNDEGKRESRMAVATFNTLKFANTLKAAGVPDKQAEAKAEAISEALSVNFKELVTKEDLKHEIRETEQRLNAKIDGLNAKIDGIEQRLNAKIDTAVASLKGEILTVRYMFGIVVTLFIAMAARVFFTHVQ
jgi:DNA repair exonuclease SbcCD ATPase subunit